MKNVLGFQAFCNPENLNLKKEYKQKRNCLISHLRNAEIKYYSNELDINIDDILKIWKILEKDLVKIQINRKEK